MSQDDVIQAAEIYLAIAAYVLILVAAFVLVLRS